MIDVNQITAMLRAENVNIPSVHEQKRVWFASFDVEGKKQQVILFLPSDSEYLLMISPMTVAKLLGQSLDSMPVETLRTIIRVSSEVPLAKVMYQSDAPMFLTTSECSVEDVNGKKLKRRMEACAKLAAKLSLALA